MSSDCTVLYNGSCPICSREIAAYRRAADRDAPHLTFRDVTSDATTGDLDALGLSRDAAARRFHVVADGRVLAGLDAFLVLWAALPGWRWLARVLGRPPLRPVAAAAYERVAAPLLYALHRRRTARAALAESHRRD
jgi:predicted DCC family thiol-disulfide oxidoreductase YuxK